MGKKAIGRLLGIGHKIRKGRILKREAKQSQETVEHVAEDVVSKTVDEEIVAEAVVEEVEDAVEAPVSKSKRSYARKKKSSKSSK